MDPLATTDDLTARWRALSTTGSPSETDVASQLLSDASDLLRDARPDIDARILAGTVRPGTVIICICQMVKRVLANPNLLTAQSVSSISRGFMTGLGMLELLPGDLAIIDGSTGGAMRSIRARAGWGQPGRGWC